MAEKTLKSYLIKAEYLLVFIKTPKKAPARMSLTGVHIPSMDFGKTIKSTKTHQNPLRRTLSRKQQIDNLRKLLFSGNTVKISLMGKATETNHKAFKAAKITSTISKRQDLHLLHYAKIYSANTSRKDRPMKGWKIPCPIHVTKQFQYVLRTPVVKPTKKFLNKFTLISRFKEDVPQKDDEEFNRAGLALEKEYSHRRNYRTTNHLYT